MAIFAGGLLKIPVTFFVESRFQNDFISEYIYIIHDFWQIFFSPLPPQDLCWSPVAEISGVLGQKWRFFAVFSAVNFIEFFILFLTTV